MRTVVVRSHVGARAKQWPHQGTKNSTKRILLEPKTYHQNPRFNTQIDRKTERKRSKRFDSNLRERGGDRRITLNLKLRLTRLRIRVWEERMGEERGRAGEASVKQLRRLEWETRGKAREDVWG